MPLFDIYFWQGEEDSSIPWPDDFQPIPVSSDDTLSEALVLVSLSAWEAFVHYLEATDSQPYIVLYLNEGDTVPSEAASYMHAAVSPNTWDELRRYVQHPHQFRVREWALDLSGWLIDRLPEPFEQSDVPKLEDLLRREVPGQALPRDIKRYLIHDQVCVQVFDETLKVERALRWTIAGPTTDDLAAYALGDLSQATQVYIGAYLDRSPVARAKFNVLRRKLPRRVEVPLHEYRGGEDDIAMSSEAQQSLEQQFTALLGNNEDKEAIRQLIHDSALQLVHAQILLRMLVDFWYASLRQRRLGHYRGEQHGERTSDDKRSLDVDIPDLLVRLLRKETVTLVQEETTLDIRIDAVQGHLIIEKVQSQGRDQKTYFFVEVCRDDEVLQEWQSDQGRITMLFEQLHDALNGQANRLRVVSG